MSQIAPQILFDDCDRALAQWPFLPTVEAFYGLPPWLLFAIGSRETNLTDEIGDGGHGHGVFQLDDRSHIIPNPFPVSLQASTAANELRGLLARVGGNVDEAADLYNSGYPYDQPTTGHNYGTDVSGRRLLCVAHYLPPAPSPPPTEELNMFKSTPDGKGFWVCKPSGAVGTGGDAKYFGGCNPGASSPFPPGETAVGFDCTPTGLGYWIYGSNNQLYAFGDAPYFTPPNVSVVFHEPADG
jgi:hypothetical protein